MPPRVPTAYAGLILGITFGALHLFWAVLVAMGAAQPLLDLIFRLHFIAPVFQVDPFDAGRAAELVGLTSLVGFAVGCGFAAIWNALAASYRSTPVE